MSPAAINRRKNNVIVTGLPESDSPIISEQSESDLKLFTSLCEEHLSVKPSVARQGCKRLGHASRGKPRKLLIHLNSEFAATSLLSVAKELRTNDNATIAANVYINPDLSPADAKLAFERRQRKRERKLANAPTFQAPRSKLRLW